MTVPGRQHALRSARGLAALLLAAAAGGCGLGAGTPPATVHLRVTDDFGAKVIAEPAAPKQAGADTVMRLLQRNAKVTTRYGGGFVQSIGDLSGQSGAGRQVDWFFYVNGVLADRGAASWRVRDGERIWWDRHRWDLAQIDAVVGDFPQPLRSGSDGKWRGARLDCRASTVVCELVQTRLRNAGVTVQAEAADADSAAQTRVVVGPWTAIRQAAPEVEALEDGPESSGVFAKVARGGAVAALDPSGQAVPGDPSTGADGLVAATRQGSSGPVWVVTGGTERAVASAARALDAEVLAGRAAVLVRDGRSYPLPWRATAEGRSVPQ